MSDSKKHGSEDAAPCEGVGVVHGIHVGQQCPSVPRSWLMLCDREDLANVLTKANQTGAPCTGRLLSPLW